MAADSSYRRAYRAGAQLVLMSAVAAAEWLMWRGGAQTGCFALTLTGIPFATIFGSMLGDMLWQRTRARVIGIPVPLLAKLAMLDARYADDLSALRQAPLGLERMEALSEERLRAYFSARDLAYAELSTSPPLESLRIDDASEKPGVLRVPSVFLENESDFDESSAVERARSINRIA